MNNPKISVIIPVYNVEQYLRECLDSVVNQTFRDLEIICVNDGSTDGSPAILDEYAAKDSRIQIVNKENGGLNSARNAGLERVTCEYFAIVDSDDWLDVTAYEKAYDRAIESGSDMTQYNFTLVDFPNRNDEKVPLSGNEIENQTEKVQCVRNNLSVCWCYLWKTEFVKKNQIQFHNNLKSNDEITFTYKAALLANKIAIIPERLHYYRYRATSLTGNKKEPSLIQRPLAFTLLFQDIEGCNVPEPILLMFYQMKWRNLYGTYYYLINKSFRPKMRRMIAENISEKEYSLLLNPEVKLNSGVRNFYLQFYGLAFNRFKYRLKFIKGRIADFFARFLFPHSPWLQEFGEREEDYKEKYTAICKLMHKGQNNNPSD